MGNEIAAEQQTLTIFAKMLSARIEFHSVELVKTGLNEFTAGRYFKLEDFLPYAMECCANNGLIPIVSFSTEYATMTVYDVENGDSFVITSPMSTAQLKACHPVQNLGAVESYERRYLWLALMECLEGDAVEEQKPSAELATPEQIAALYDYSETDLMTDGQKMWLEKASDKMTESQAAYVLEKLHEKEAEQDD